MEPVLDLIALSGHVPPDTLQDRKQETPFFQVGPKGFLLKPPSGGRIHYAPGQGISVADAPNRPPGDLQPFVLSSGFSAAAWFDGRVPLSVNAVRFEDGRLILIASDREDLHEEMALVMADALGLQVSDAPVAIDPEDPTRVCTNGEPITVRRSKRDASEPPVREGARRLRLDRPAIDGRVVHPCAGLVCVAEGQEPTARLASISLIHCIAEIKKHVFMPLVGTAIWGEQTINAAHLVLANNMPMYRYTLPAKVRPTAELAADLVAQLNAVEEG